MATIHTVDLLEEALALCELAGFDVRRQWMAEGIGGPCRVGEKLVLFVNLADSAQEQLDQAIRALREMDYPPISPPPKISDALRRLLT